MHIKFLIISLFFTSWFIFAQNCNSELIIETNKVSLVSIDSISLVGNNLSKKISKGIHTITLQEYRKWNSQLFNDTIIVSNCNEIILKKYSFSENNFYNNDVLLNVNRKINSNKFYESSLFNVLLGTSIALGVTAAVFKINADRQYDEYQLNKNSEILKKVNRYDLISGISFGLLQINFGYLIYRFIND